MPSARKGERAPRGSIALALPRGDREAALAVDAGALGAFCLRPRALRVGSSEAEPAPRSSCSPAGLIRGLQCAQRDMKRARARLDCCV